MAKGVCQADMFSTHSWKIALSIETLPISLYVACEARFILRWLIIFNVWERIGIKIQIVLLHNSWQKGGCPADIFSTHSW